MPIDEKYEESELLHLLAQSSERTFQLIFEQHSNKVYRIANLYVKSPEMAEEIVQDVFLKLWLQRANLTEIQSIEAWLFTLTKNHVLNHLKKVAHEWKVREKWTKEVPQTENNTDYRIRNAQYKELIDEAINNLSQQQKLIYMMAKEEGLSYEAIGEKLSISPLTVKTHMARALQAIRSFLKQHGDALIVFIILSKKFF